MVCVVYLICVALFSTNALAEISTNPKETIYVGASIAGGGAMGFCDPTGKYVPRGILRGNKLSFSKDWGWSVFGGGYGRALNWQNAVLGFGLFYSGGFSLKGTLYDKRLDKKYGWDYDIQGLHGPGVFVSIGKASGQRNSVHLLAGLLKRGGKLTLSSQKIYTLDSHFSAAGWMLGVRYMRPLYNLIVPISLVFSYEVHGFLSTKYITKGRHKETGTLKQITLFGSPKISCFATAHYLSVGLVYCF